MGVRRRVSALLAGVAVAIGAFVLVAPGGGAAVAAVSCSAPAWAEGNTYPVGSQVTYGGHLYQALVTHTAYVGAGWNPAATPSLWTDLGACSGGTTTPPTTAPLTIAPTSAGVRASATRFRSSVGPLSLVTPGGRRPAQRVWRPGVARSLPSRARVR